MYVILYAYISRELVLDLVPKYVEYLHKNKVDGVYGVRSLFLYSNCTVNTTIQVNFRFIYYIYISII